MMDIVITGTSKSGKTSIKKVVFEKMPPCQSKYIEPTETPETFNVETLGYCKLNVTEFPSTFNYEKCNEEYEKILNSCGTLIFIINSLESIDNQYEYFKRNITPIFGKHKNISLSIFIHKNDKPNISISDFNIKKGEIQKKFTQMKDTITLNYYITSIYDSTVFEAFSQILQNMIPQNKNLSILIDIIANNCKFEKVYLFDVFNKLYLAANTSSIESSKTYEICSDLIDVILDMCGAYGGESFNETYFDNDFNCCIKINDSCKDDTASKNVLCLKFIDYNLALIFIMDEKYYERTNIMDYNVKIFRETVKKILNKN